MGMRTDCKHYESRTYKSGEVVRKCRIDLAPEAPWRCPAECSGYQRRMIDVGWQYGSLSEAHEPADPVPAAGDDVAALLEEAEQIVNLAGLDLHAEQAKRKRKGMFRKRKRR